MTDYDPSFEALWSAYPKRNGRKVKKAPAYKKWLTLTSSERAALLASVEKNNRQGSWGKYVRDLVTYINQGGHEDEVDDPVQAATPAYHLMPEPPHECTKWEALANRWLLTWLRAAGGVQEIYAAVEVKNHCVLEMADALDEDLAADPSRDSQAEVIWTFLSVLIDRLDARFDTNHKPLLLK